MVMITKWEANYADLLSILCNGRRGHKHFGTGGVTLINLMSLLPPACTKSNGEDIQAQQPPTTTTWLPCPSYWKRSRWLQIQLVDGHYVNKTIVVRVGLGQHSNLPRRRRALFGQSVLVFTFLTFWAGIICKCARSWWWRWWWWLWSSGRGDYANYRKFQNIDRTRWEDGRDTVVVVTCSPRTPGDDYIESMSSSFINISIVDDHDNVTPRAVVPHRRSKVDCKKLASTFSRFPFRRERVHSRCHHLVISLPLASI